MMAMSGFGTVLCFCTLISLIQVGGTIPDFWKLFAPGTVKVTTQVPAKSISVNEKSVVEIDFPIKGTKIHPTESSPYPTPPAPDAGFAKWEAEQERKYAQEILAKLATPNDTELQLVAKTLIANFVVNTAVDDATAWDRLNASTKQDSYETYPEDGQSIQQQQQQQQQLSPSAEELKEQFYKAQQQQQLIYEQVNQEVQTSPAPFNPVQSILNALSQNRTEDGGQGSSPLGALGGVLSMFAPKPSLPRTTPDPEISTEYYVVPINPITEKNPISKQQANLGKHVQRLMESVNQRNISGVVDTTLKIASLETIGVFVTGFLNILLCNPIDRLNGRCDE